MPAKRRPLTPITVAEEARERGILSLAVTHPEVAQQWHPDMNGELCPSDVASTSTRIVWWMCDAAPPHTWQASISARALSDARCPGCSKPAKKLLKDHYPDLARQVHPTKNLPLTLDTIGIGTERRLWWRCAENPSHEWDARIASRIKQPRCPICAGRLLTPETSLSARFPGIAMEWHPTKNGALRPEDVLPSSTKRRWWRCSINPAHEWETTVWLRTKENTNCPVCCGSFLSPEVAFAATHPHVALEWHPTKNGDLKPDQMRAGSDRRVWWQCSRDKTHEWRAIIGNRSRGHACPMCSGRVATAKTSLLALHPEVAALWHPTKNGALTPDKVKPNAKKKVWWRCAANPKHEWQAVPKGMGRCPICVGKKVTSSNSLAGAAPAISAEWHPTRNGDLDPRSLYQYSLVRAWWRCALDPTHEWESTIASRVKNGTRCPFCAGRAAGPTTSLAALYPDVAVEWHPEKNAPLSPGDVVPGASAKVWWRCRLGHEWQGRVYERTKLGGGCRLCFLERHRVWLAENNRLRAKLRRDAGA
jgi:hypothetical protein